MLWAIRGQIELTSIRAWLPAALHYIFSAVLSQGGYCLVIALLIHYRDPCELAWATLCHSLIIWMSTLASWGMRQPYAIWCMKLPCAERVTLTLYAARKLVLIAVPTLIVGALIACLLVPEYWLMIMLSSVGALVSMLSELLVQHSMYTHQTRHYMRYKSLQALLWVVFFGGCLYAGGGGFACMSAYIAATACIVVGGLVSLWRQTKGPYVRHEMPDIGRWWWLGVQYIPTLVATWLVAYSSRWLLFKAGLIAQVAYWSVIEYIGPLFQATVLQVINGVFWPASMDYYATDEHMAERHAYRVIVASVMFLVPVGMIGWACVISIGRGWLPLPYHAALPGGYGVIISNIIHAVGYLLMPRLHAREQVWPISLSLMIGCGVQLLVGWYTVPVQGVYGCVVALLSGQMVYLATLVLVRSWVVRRPSCGIAKMGKTGILVI
jgi:hypothetical protein